MFFATDIANFLAWQHIATLNREQAERKISKKVFADPGAELLRKLVLEHELKYLNELKGRGLKVVEIATDASWSEAAEATREAMVEGADVVYQATFVQRESPSGDGGLRSGDGGPRPGDGGLRSGDGGPRSGDGGPRSGDGRRDARDPSPSVWGGRADFLLRVDKSSELGDWSYEVVETKLAKSTKARALIQLCFYSELVASVQGKVPERMHVVLGRGAQPEEFSVQRYLAYFRKVKREFQKALAARPITYPEPVEHCSVCDWFLHCDERRHVDDHLSLVANITRNQRNALAQREVNTVAKLANLTLPVTPKIDRIDPAPLLRIREQARVQVRSRDEGRHVYEFVEFGETHKLT